MDPTSSKTAPSMKTVGSYEAKTRLPELLRDVERGEVVTVTRRGVPIARITGVESDNRQEISDAIREIRRQRAQRKSVSVNEIIKARDEGRRY